MSFNNEPSWKITLSWRSKTLLRNVSRWYVAYAPIIKVSSQNSFGTNLPMLISDLEFNLKQMWKVNFHWKNAKEFKQPNLKKYRTTIDFKKTFFQDLMEKRIEFWCWLLNLSKGKSRIRIKFKCQISILQLNFQGSYEEAEW